MNLEERLVRLEQELEELKAEYEDYAYIVSHDLSAPLRHIEGFASLISDDIYEDLDPKNQDRFDRIISSSQNTKDILKSLLEYSRLNSRQEPFQEIDCNSLVQEALEDLKDLIEPTTTIIKINPLPSIKADPKQIRLAFYHLLHNALFYHPENATPQIELTCETSNTHWQFYLRDNGIGIKETLIPKVMKPLRRAVLSSNYEGMGMGLTIADKVIKRHKGKLWIESSIGHGSTVVFTIEK